MFKNHHDFSYCYDEQNSTKTDFRKHIFNDNHNLWNKKENYCEFYYYFLKHIQNIMQANQN